MTSCCCRLIQPETRRRRKASGAGESIGEACPGPASRPRMECGAFACAEIQQGQVYADVVRICRGLGRVFRAARDIEFGSCLRSRTTLQPDCHAPIWKFRVHRAQFSRFVPPNRASIRRFSTHSELSCQRYNGAAWAVGPPRLSDFQRSAALFRSRGNSSRKTRRSVASSGSRLVPTYSLSAALMNV